MIGQLVGPVANLASSWLQGKADKATANAKLKLVEAESKAAILMSKETSTADWERIMAESTKKEWYTWLVFAVCSAAIGIRGGKQFMGKK